MTQPITAAQRLNRKAEAVMKTYPHGAMMALAADVAIVVRERDMFLDLLEDCRDVLDGVLGNCEPDCECILHALDEVLPTKAPVS